MKSTIGVIISVFLCATLSIAAFAGGKAKPEKQATAKEKHKKDKSGPVKTTGDDLFPWPWGSEVLFPWQTLTGTYMAVAPIADTYSGHFIDVIIGYDKSNSPYAQIYQFDRSGKLFATGIGYAERNPRLVTAKMTTEVTKRSYTATFRAYKAKLKGDNVTPVTDVVSAVTFCPLRAKNCKERTSYMLQRLP